MRTNKSALEKIADLKDMFFLENEMYPLQTLQIYVKNEINITDNN